MSLDVAVTFPAPVDHMSVVQLRAVFIEASVHEEFYFVVSSGVSTVALLARVAKSENELIDRVVSEASALAAWDIAKKYHAKDMLVPVTAPHSAEASLTLSPPLGSAPVSSTLKPGVWAS